MFETEVNRQGLEDRALAIIKLAKDVEYYHFLLMRLSDREGEERNREMLAYSIDRLHVYFTAGE